MLLIILVLVASCSGDEPTLEKAYRSTDDNPYIISLQRMLANGEEMYRQIYGKTRTLNTVKNIIKLKSATRSTSIDDLELYVVNYTEGGYALLSADCRLSPVYAISNEGELNLSDTVKNEGLNWYINTCLPELCSDFSGGILPDSTKHDLTEVFISFQDKVVYSEPLLGTSLSRFHQSYPYNEYCPKIDDVSCKVGCGPLAIGTIMGYYSWPLSAEGYTFNWGVMRSNPTDLSWARLFAIIGSAKFGNVNYGITSTGMYPKYVSEVFNKMQYSVSDKRGLNISLVIQEHKANSPVFVTGYKYLTNSTTGSLEQSGHAWILDGSYSITHDSPIIEDDDKGKVTDYFLHCVWGWGGSSNGYYLYYSSSLGSRPESGDNGYKSTLPAYSDLSIWYGIKPRK